ncbi:MAG: hypothetical protein MJD61_15785 [Proteobacteria bacterium]|nr:hypothetical protein [Pseudomonadota bacterium]
MSGGALGYVTARKPDHNAEPAAASGSPHRQSGSAEAIGRTVGVGVFWIVTVFVIGAGALSISRQVFPSPAASVPHDPLATGWCGREISALQAELLGRAGGFISDALSREPLDAWLAKWDTRKVELARRCPTLKQAQRDLAELRLITVRMLEGFKQQQDPVLRRIRTAVQKAPHDQSLSRRPP